MIDQVRGNGHLWHGRSHKHEVSLQRGGRPIPVSKSTVWAGVASGRVPKPVKLGPSITAWRLDDSERFVLEIGTVNRVLAAARSIKRPRASAEEIHDGLKRPLVDDDPSPTGRVGSDVN